MRVLYDHQVFSLQDAGGASRYHYELARHLSGHSDVDVSTYLGLNNNVHAFSSLRDIDLLSIKSAIKPGIARYAVNEVLTGGRATLSRRWDVYHPTLYRAMPFTRHRKLVVTHHDCTHEWYPELFQDVHRILRSKAKLFAEADQIICVSESSKSDLLRFYSIEAKKVHVVHHGIEPCRHNKQVAGEFTNRLARPYLLFVGARHSYKNFVPFLRAYASAGLARDYDILAIGGGEWSVEEIAISQALGVIKHLVLIPRADDSTLANAYSRAALFVYPSLYEGFGFPPLEAMSAGCLAAVSRVASMPEICGDAAFYFDPADESSIGKALLEALNSSTKDTKIKAGSQRVKAFSWPRCAQQTLQVYTSN